MHELSICLSVIRLLEKQALVEKNQLSPFYRIKQLWLEIGQLAGIELDALRFSFPIAAAQGIAKNAVLNIISIEGRAWCDQCQVSITIVTYFDPCPHCGDYHYQITQGKELRISKMEVE